MAPPKNLKKDQLLIIRAPGDEASAALAFFQIISQLSVRVFLLFTSLNKRLEWWTDGWSSKRSTLALMAIGGFAGFMIAAVVGAVLWVRFERVLVVAPAVAVAALGLLISLDAAGRFLSSPQAQPIRLGTIVFRVLAGTVLLPVLVLLSVLLVPFGAKFAFASLFLDVTAETTPMGAWSVDQIRPFVAPGGNPPLTHSGVYANPQTLDVICKWMAERERRICGHSDAGGHS
jgi:hypothetical protein